MDYNNQEKPYSACEPMDSFWINLNFLAGQTLPVMNQFQLPTLLNKQVKYFRITNLVVYSANTTTNVGTVIIKCDTIASSDKILATFNTAGTVNAATTVNINKVVKVISPMAGQLNLYIDRLSTDAVNNSIVGTVSIGIDCYY